MDRLYCGTVLHIIDHGLGFKVSRVCGRKWEVQIPMYCKMCIKQEHLLILPKILWERLLKSLFKGTITPDFSGLFLVHVYVYRRSRPDKEPLLFFPNFQSLVRFCIIITISGAVKARSKRINNVSRHASCKFYWPPICQCVSKTLRKSYFSALGIHFVNLYCKYTRATWIWPQPGGSLRISCYGTIILHLRLVMLDINTWFNIFKPFGYRINRA